MAIGLGAFDLETPIGRGGMGEVWRGVHRRQGVPVAVKVLTAEMAREERYLAAFRNEVRSVAGLSHRNIVLVYDAGVVDDAAAEESDGRLVSGSPWLAMELARGPLEGPIPWAQARPLVRELLAALAHAHARGVVHRDLKPGNVLVTARAASSEARSNPESSGAGATVKLTDFGLAHAVREADWAARTAAAGTPAFMAPEQVTGRWRDFGPWTDLYALGRLVLDLLTGSPEGSAQRVALLPDVPRAFAGWMERLLAPRIGDRFRQAADAAWALDRFEEAPEEVRALLGGAFVEISRPTQVTWLAEADAADAAEAPPSEPGLVPPMAADWREAEAPFAHLSGVGLGLYGLRSIPLVDREQARDRLWAALSAVRADGKPRLVVLRGGSGVGKSRLAAWLGERAHERGAAHVVVATHAPEPGPSDGLAPLVARLLRTQGLDRAAVGRRVERLLAGAEDEAEALVELVAPSLAEEPRGSSAERHALVERLLARSGADRPVVVVLEDAQWGADALAFARRVLARGTSPFLLVLTVGDEHLGPVEARLLAALGGEEIVVEPLSGDDRRALVRGLLGLAGDLALQVEDRTAGNPLFAVHLVGDWVQRGLLLPGERGFHLSEGARVDLPDDLHAVWSAQVGRVLEGATPEEGASIELAAVLGIDVDASEWAAACRLAGLAPAFDLAERLIAQRLARSEEGPRVRWELVHPLVRETLERRAEEGGRRIGHHLACAEMLASARGLSVPERRGRHLLAAGRPAEALVPLGEAADRAIVHGEYQRTGSLLAARARALDLAGVAPGDERRVDHAWLTGRHARVEGRLAEAEVAFDLAARGYAAVGRDSGRGRTLAEHAQVLTDRGDSGRAWEHAEEALAIGVRIDDRGVRARARWALGGVLADRRASQEAFDVYEAARADFEALGLPVSADRCRKAMALCLGELGRHEEAKGILEHSLRENQRLGSRAGVAACLSDLGILAYQRGDTAEADRRLGEALIAFRALGAISNTITTQYNLAHIALVRGDAAASLAGVRAVFGEFPEEGRRTMWSALHWLGAAASVALGDDAGWDAHVAAGALELPRWADSTVADMAETAADHATSAGRPERAAEARAVARAHREALAGS